MLFSFRRKELPWEVVDSRSVEPVPIYYEDDDLDILSVGDGIMRGTYIFDLKHLQASMPFRSALVFARQQLLQASERKGFNILLLESWDLILYRRGKQHRVEVRYSGYPALGKGARHQGPPFIGVLD